jgi:hypothetical protein
MKQDILEAKGRSVVWSVPTGMALLRPLLATLGAGVSARALLRMGVADLVGYDCDPGGYFAATSEWEYGPFEPGAAFD